MKKFISLLAILFLVLEVNAIELPSSAAESKNTNYNAPRYTIPMAASELSGGVTTNYTYGQFTAGAPIIRMTNGWTPPSDPQNPEPGEGNRPINGGEGELDDIDNPNDPNWTPMGAVPFLFMLALAFGFVAYRRRRI